MIKVNLSKSVNVGNQVNKKVLPDILYSQSYDGEIVIEWNESSRKLNLLTLVDMSAVF
jgi:hypothetical protein